MKNKNLQIILAVLILLAFGFLLYPKNHQDSSAYPNRQFDINKNFFQTEAYPSEITNITDDNLVGMKCGDSYSRQIDGSYVSFAGSKQAKNADSEILNLVKMAEKTIDTQQVDAIMSCHAADNRIIIVYHTLGGGGGSKNVAHFGLVNDDNVKKITSISNYGTPYFVCNEPLQLTTSNILYYACGGGDSNVGSSTIYKIDLSADSYSSVLQCSSSGDETGKVTVSCK